MSDYQVDIQKNQKEVVRVSVGEFEGKELLNLRIWYKLDEDDTEYKPSKKGIAISTSKYGELMKALEDAKEFITV